MESSAEEERSRMVDRDIASRGVADPAVIAAMRTVPRERFVPESLRGSAHEDHPLPIGEGQTISQPLMVAIMAEAAELTPDDRVLEVGTGSGYGAAVLAQLAGSVVTIERHGSLAATARERLDELGYRTVDVVHGDGSLGVPDRAPFDAIVVTAGATEVPGALVEQLVDGGRLVIPVGPRSDAQRLLRIRRRGDRTTQEDLGAVRFVPLVADP